MRPLATVVQDEWSPPPRPATAGGNRTRRTGRLVRPIEPVETAVSRQDDPGGTQPTRGQSRVARLLRRHVDLILVVHLRESAHREGALLLIGSGLVNEEDEITLRLTSISRHALADEERLPADRQLRL